MATDQTEMVSWAGSTYRTILSLEASNGAMSIVDSTTDVGSGPPRHVHANEDEIFVVLSGEIELWKAGELSRIGPGETGFIPRGMEHTFRVSSDLPCRHLVILTPGGFEGFFFEMAAGNLSIPEDMPAIVASGTAHGLTFTGPPL